MYLYAMMASLPAAPPPLILLSSKTQLFYSPKYPHKPNPIITSIIFPSLLVLKYYKKGAIKSSSSAGGLYSSKQFGLTLQNVDLVLDDVRPYLISDGGDVEVCSVQNGVVSLKLQGACESCPSSTTTMKMGIERVLKEKFGDAVKEIRQVYDEQPNVTTVEAVNNHLEILRPAIKNYGGSVEVLSIDGGDCLVRYVGPESIGSGVKAAIKEKFPDITNVVFDG